MTFLVSGLVNVFGKNTLRFMTSSPLRASRWSQASLSRASKRCDRRTMGHHKQRACQTARQTSRAVTDHQTAEKPMVVRGKDENIDFTSEICERMICVSHVGFDDGSDDVVEIRKASGRIKYQTPHSTLGVGPVGAVDDPDRVDVRTGFVGEAACEAKCCAGLVGAIEVGSNGCHWMLRHFRIPAWRDRDRTFGVTQSCARPIGRPEATRASPVMRADDDEVG